MGQSGPDNSNRRLTVASEVTKKKEFLPAAFQDIDEQDGLYSRGKTHHLVPFLRFKSTVTSLDSLSLKIRRGNAVSFPDAYMPQTVEVLPIPFAEFLDSPSTT